MEFLGEASQSLMMRFMSARPGLLDYKRAFGLQLREHQSAMGISVQE